MTPMILPLVVSLAAVGINAGTYRPAAEPVAAVVDLRDLASGVSFEPAAYPAGVDGWRGDAAYPEKFRWSANDDRAPLPAAGQPGRQSVLVSARTDLINIGADPAAADDSEFEVTRGAGLVGIGFRVRFR